MQASAPIFAIRILEALNTVQYIKRILVRLTLSFSCVITAGASYAQQVVASGGDLFSDHYIADSGQTDVIVVNNHSKPSDDFSNTQIKISIIEELLKRPKLITYANPTSEYLMIEFSEAPEYALDILLITQEGSVIESTKPLRGQKKVKIDMSRCNSGHFMLNIINSEKMTERNTYSILKSD